MIKFFFATLILMIFSGCSTESIDLVNQDSDNFAKSASNQTEHVFVLEEVRSKQIDKLELNLLKD